MTDSTAQDTGILYLLRTVRSIAVIGASANEARPSHGVMKFLIGHGYAVHPVNPGHAGGTILGRTVFGSLSEIPSAIDMVDIFRNSEAAGAVVDEAIALAAEKGIRAVWMQLGVINEAAAEKARAAGLIVIMDRCPKIEYARQRVNGR